MLVAAMLAGLIYLNYWQGLQHRYVDAGTTWLARFTGYYLLYLFPFATAFFLQLFFYKDCSYYKNGWFWTILLAAPAFFSLKVNFDFQQGWILHRWQGADREFYLKSINWVVKAGVLMILVWIVWLLKDKNNQPFYGASRLDSLKPYLWMLLIMVPLIALASTRADFLAAYPKAKFIDQLPVNGWQDKWRYVVFELCYGFDFISIEFFFRGFLILGLLRCCGMQCIIPVACFYCAIHLGKPMAEAVSSFFGGAFLGIIVYNTGSVWGGLLVHVGIAWLMEIGGWAALGFAKAKAATLVFTKIK